MTKRDDFLRLSAIETLILDPLVQGTEMYGLELTPLGLRVREAWALARRKLAREGA